MPKFRPINNKTKKAKSKTTSLRSAANTKPHAQKGTGPKGKKVRGIHGLITAIAADKRTKPQPAKAVSTKPKKKKTPKRKYQANLRGKMGFTRHDEKKK